MKKREKPRPRTPHQLPPGRHKLGRKFVQDNQRERILEAVADVTSLAGYAGTSVEDIIGTAGVSRRTFYDTFASKETAFLAALADVGGQLLGRMDAACAASDTFAGGVRDCLATFLDFVTAEPRYADMMLIESLAAGTLAIELRNATMRRFAELLRGSAERLGAAHRPPDLTAETIVGGIYDVVYSRVIAGESRQLPTLLGDLVYSTLQPYIGHQAARREASKPASAHSGGENGTEAVA